LSRGQAARRAFIESLNLFSHPTTVGDAHTERVRQ